MSELIEILGFGIFGYLSGSLSFALWIAKLVKGIDLRDEGSGHAGTTNTIRQAGLGPGVLVLIFDIGKGFIPTFFAIKYATSEWTIILAGVFAVIGHCWPIFAQFKGGMGLATGGGSILALYPLGFAIALAIIISLNLIIKHSARASVIASFFYAPTFFIFGGKGTIIWLALGIGIVLAVRFYVDWNREYKELWLDRG